MSDYDGKGENINFREEILRLVSEGKIKHTTKYVEKQSDESLEKIYRKSTSRDNWTRPTSRLRKP